MVEEFISETIHPVAQTLDAARMSAGGPGLPRQFRWRSETIQVARAVVLSPIGPPRYNWEV